ncbi:hypothetical protein IscW_ISCW015043 [Ixodes scapularis]|uniref:Set1/Ash2 histone methyltransferase complex subunit ASH2-like PHD zinc finger domain-containing protein n=1 Tax=Ixodes scapularis TaxID=6945 RepID=B7QLL5_IXOSC|nr:hypothetical protein IscW_ISCW015043 [Ixodes scapularis]|eukprot:XP_002416070.1 hypothetical protein IscW_ISCW015043 [Ixodes scapularis]
MAFVDTGGSRDKGGYSDQVREIADPTGHTPSATGTDIQGSELSAFKGPENADTDDNSQCTMKGDEIADEASSTETENQCARDINMEEESNLEDPTGKERNLSIVELQCIACLKWFHDTCLSLPLG